MNPESSNPKAPNEDPFESLRPPQDTTDDSSFNIELDIDNIDEVLSGFDSLRAPQETSIADQESETDTDLDPYTPRADKLPHTGIEDISAASIERLHQRVDTFAIIASAISRQFGAEELGKFGKASKVSNAPEYSYPSNEFYLNKTMRQDFTLDDLRRYDINIAPAAEVERVYDSLMQHKQSYLSEELEEEQLAQISPEAIENQLGRDQLFSEEEHRVATRLKGRTKEAYLDQFKAEQGHKLKIRHHIFGSLFKDRNNLGPELVKGILIDYAKAQSEGTPDDNDHDSEYLAEAYSSEPKDLLAWIYNQNGNTSTAFLHSVRKNIHEILKLRGTSTQAERAASRNRAGEVEQIISGNIKLADDLVSKHAEDYDRYRASITGEQSEAKTPENPTNLAEASLGMHFNAEAFSARKAELESRYPSVPVQRIDKLLFSPGITQGMEAKAEAEDIQGRADLVYFLSTNPQQMKQSAQRLIELASQDKIAVDANIILAPSATAFNQDGSQTIENFRNALNQAISTVDNIKLRSQLKEASWHFETHAHFDASSSSPETRTNYQYGKAEQNDDTIHWTEAIAIGNPIQQTRGAMLASKLNTPVTGPDSHFQYSLIPSESEALNQNYSAYQEHSSDWWTDRANNAEALQELEILGRGIHGGNISIYDAPKDATEANKIYTEAPLFTDETPSHVTKSHLFDNILLYEDRPLGETAKAISDTIFQAKKLEDLKPNSDAVVVLGNNDTFGVMSHVAKLFEAGVIDDKTKIFLSGFRNGITSDSEVKFFMQAAINFLGANPDQFILEAHAGNTKENFINVDRVAAAYQMEDAEQNGTDYNSFGLSAYDLVTVVGLELQTGRNQQYAAACNIPFEKIQHYGAYSADRYNIRPDNWQLDRQRARALDEIMRMGQYGLKGDLDLVPQDN